MAALQVEHAKSGRSECRKCRLKISKGEMRIGVESGGGGGADFVSVRWHHAGCLFAPRRHAALRDRSTSDLQGFTALRAADQSQLRRWFEGKELPGAEDDPTVAAARELKALSTSQLRAMPPAQLLQLLQSSGSAAAQPGDSGVAAEGDELVARAQALQVEQDRLQMLTEAYGRMTVAQMQAELRLNSQAVSGNKSALVPRCVDGQMYGALPHCPRCSEGRLRVAYEAKFLHGGRGKYTCSGSRDEMGWHACSFRAGTCNRPAWVVEQSGAAGAAGAIPLSPATAAAAGGAPMRVTAVVVQLPPAAANASQSPTAVAGRSLTAARAPRPSPPPQSRLQNGDDDEEDDTLELELVDADDGLDPANVVAGKRKRNAVKPRADFIADEDGEDSEATEDSGTDSDWDSPAGAGAGAGATKRRKLGHVNVAPTRNLPPVAALPAAAASTAAAASSGGDGGASAAFQLKLRSRGGASWRGRDTMIETKEDLPLSFALLSFCRATGIHDPGTYCLIVDGERAMLTRTAADYELESGDLVEVAGKGATSAASKASSSRAAASAGGSNSTISSSVPVPARRVWSWNAGRRGFSAYDASTCAVINRSYERWIAAGRASDGATATVSISAEHVIHFGLMRQQRKDNADRYRRVKMSTDD